MINSAPKVKPMATDADVCTNHDARGPRERSVRAPDPRSQKAWSWRQDSAHPTSFAEADLKPPGWYLLGKTITDFIIALILLAVAAPFILVFALLMQLTSRGPAFYSQTRLGRFGRPFKIIKIRTMVHDCERATGPCWATPHDPRITKLGRFLRRTHLDELPQLWNVLRGDMSLVGPRPERPEFVHVLEHSLPSYRQRMLVRPGVTGLAQLQLPPDSDLNSVRRKLAYDIYYIRHCGGRLDLRILACTVAYFVGVPSRWIHRLLAIPGPERVEADLPTGHGLTPALAASPIR